MFHRIFSSIHISSQISKVCEVVFQIRFLFENMPSIYMQVQITKYKSRHLIFISILNRYQSTFAITDESGSILVE